MPLVTYPGGQRERDIYLYWWDERDGDAWSGWWVTPDFPGNQEFILHGPRDTKHPADLAVGEWRSPLVEQQQLKRSLGLGFTQQSGSEALHAEGPASQPEPCHRYYARSLTRPHLPQDAETNIIPDNASIYIFANYVWIPDGLHHCKPKFKVCARDTGTRARLVPAHRAHGALHPDLRQTPDLKARDLTAEERAQRSGKAGGGAEGGGTVTVEQAASPPSSALPRLARPALYPDAARPDDAQAELLVAHLSCRCRYKGRVDGACAASQGDR